MFKKTKSISSFQNSESQTYTGTQELLDTEVALIRYSRGIVRKFCFKMDLRERIIEKNGTLLEFGAGTGFLAEIFQDQFQITPDCVELDPTLMKNIRDKGLTCFQFLRETPRNYSAIYTSNVLEHIENDSEVLKELYDSLEPGGIIGIYVPAHPILYSAMDHKIGHVRRYKRSELKKKVLSAGFTVQSINFDEFIGFFASTIVKIIGYKNGANLGSKSSLRLYDRYVYPFSNILDLLGCRFILGKNLLLIATKE